MLDGRGDDRARLGGRRDHALDRPVIAVGAAGGEEDLLGVGVDAVGNGGTRLRQGLAGSSREGIRLDALPYSSSKNGFIASNASGSNLVVAAWSA